MHTLLAGPSIFCQFATHNARSVAQVIEATEHREISFELQKLHGMGDLLYTLVCEQHPHICRKDLRTRGTTRGSTALSRETSFGEWGKQFIR
jgi:hypothetical protein